MSYLKNLQARYPKTGSVRYALQSYNCHKEFEGKDPTVVTVHETTLDYGGPEEGGWWYQSGYPQASHCIFSKRQAIQTFINLTEEYEVAEQPSLGLSTTYHNYEVNFSNGIAQRYPIERPHYC